MTELGQLIADPASLDVEAWDRRKPVATRIQAETGRNSQQAESGRTLEQR